MPHVAVRKRLETWKNSWTNKACKNYLKNCAHGQTSLSLQLPMLSVLPRNRHFGYHGVAAWWYIPDACHVMKIEERSANVSFTRNNSQVHGADQHESELERPSCMQKNTWAPIFSNNSCSQHRGLEVNTVGSHFWAVTHCCKYPIWPRMLSPYVLATRNTRLPKWTSSKLTSTKVKFRAYGSW
jgi:hypothetical protein